MNHDKPLISIATVTYNAQATLERTLKSVACQTYANIEHVIVDGCSLDNTPLMVQRYVEHNTNAQVPHQILFVRERDRGLYDAMNKAIRAAHGDYIVFLNAGDKLHSTDTIENIVKKIDWQKGYAQNPAIVYGETDIVDNQGHFISHRRHKAPEQLTWLHFAQGMKVCHQSFYVRMDFARGIPYNLQYRYSADFDWCIRLMKLAERKHIPILNTHLILTDYLSEGLTTANHRKSLIERMHIMAEYYGWFTTIVNHIGFVLKSL